MSRDDDEALEQRLRRRIAAALDALAVDPPVRVRPLAPRRRRSRTAGVALVAAALVAGASVGAVASRGARPTRARSHAQAAATPVPSAPRTAAPAASQPPRGGAAGAAPVHTAAPRPVSVGPRCQAGDNGGVTDAGVTASSIAVATTVTDSGAMQSEGQAALGMLAALNTVNGAGGICGRVLHLSQREDGGDAATGRSEIDGFIDGGSSFALVMPSAPGFVAASQGGDIDRAGMPVAGYDAELAPALDDPWAWPVAAPLSAAMRTLAHDAARRGAHSFALVYDTQLPDAAAAAGAFRAQVQRDGGTLGGACVIALNGQADPTSSYSAFDRSCGWDSSGGGVDYVGFALGPAAQQSWEGAASADSRGAYYGVRRDGSGDGAGSATQTMVESDLSGCGDWCSHVWSWTSVLPWDAPFTAQADVQGFAAACRATSGCNPTSSFAEAGWASMQMLVDGLRAIGPVVTRTALRQWLDGASLDTGTVLPIAFQRGTHLGAQSLRPVVAGPGGLAWAEPAAGDPCPGCTDPSIS